MMYQRRGHRPYFSYDISAVVLLLNILIMLLVYYIPMISAFTIQNRYQHNSVHHYNSLLQQHHHHPSRRYQHHYNAISRTILSTSSNDNDINDEEEEEELPPIIDGYNLFDDDDTNTQSSTSEYKEELQLMTVNQLKQQLRLRGKKITGNKVDLINRLLDNSVVDATIIDSSSESEGGGNDRMTNGYTKYEKSYATLKRNSLLDINDNDDDDEEESNDTSTTKQKKQKNVETKRVVEAKSRGGDIVDVTEYINPDEVGKSFKSSDATSATSNTLDIDYEEVNDEFSIDVDIINTTSPKSTSSSTKSTTTKDDESSSTSSSEASNPEVWGEDAKIIKDYEGKAIVVDGLSRTIIEYKGCNDVLVQAYVVGSRMAMSNFLKGGISQSEQTDDDDDEGEGGDSEERNKYKSMEEEVYAIQSKRELESKRGLTQTMLDNDDFETRQEDPTDKQSKELYSTVERDYGDWGVYTPTGAQLSSTEVQGVLLLSDVYGPFTDSTQTLADKIAFECQPVVVIVPDMFRGDPWSEDRANDSDDVERQTLYEEWRGKHPEYRVDIDIRAAASVLRERYAVSSIAVWGTCYGGGRALEAAAGWYPGCTSTSYYEEMNSSQSKPPPPHVDPVAAIAWYPTRYNTKQLFGKDNEGYRTFHNGNDRKVAIMAVFAGNDVLPGATPDDANLLKECLENDPRVVDYMVKIFPNQEHGFAHNHLGMEKTNDVSSNEEDSDDTQDDRFLGEDFGSSIEPLEMGGDAEVACLLSTAWMETYTRVFLPTVGTPVRYDENEEWSSTIEMNKRTEQRPDIRTEIDDAIFNFDDVDVDIGRMSQSASPLLEDGPGIEKYEQIEEERERIRQEILEKYDIQEDDDEETFDLKFKQAQADGALDGLLLDAYLDDSGDAYW